MATIGILYEGRGEEGEPPPHRLALLSGALASLVIVLVISIGAFLPGVVRPLGIGQPGDVFWGGQGRQPG